MADDANIIYESGKAKQGRLKDERLSKLKQEAAPTPYRRGYGVDNFVTAFRNEKNKQAYLKELAKGDK